MDQQTAILSQNLGWFLLAAFGLLWVYLGIFWGRKAKNLEGHMLAGRNVGLAFGTATAMATWVTSNTTMLAPQFALQLGIWGMLAYSTASFGLFFFAPMARRIRRLMPQGFTSGDFIRLRYGKKAWGIFLLISLFYSITWLISMGMAGGLFLNAVAGIPYQYGMSVILLVCVLYTVFGGLYAVIGTDFIQSVIILIGVVIVGAVIFLQIDFDSTYSTIAADQPALLMVILPAAIMAFFNNMLFGMGEIFHNNVWWSRAFAMRPGVAFKAYIFGGLFWLPIPVAVGFIALASGSLGINIIRPDMVGPLAAVEVLGYFGAILVFIVIFCSLASSIDSLLAATSDLITEDIYRKAFRPQASEQNLRKVSIYVIIGLGFVAWLVCLPNIATLAAVLFFAGPMVGSAIWPVAAGLFWRRANPLGAFLAMLLGSIVGLIFYFEIGWYSGSLVGAAVSMIIVLLSTSFFPRDFDWNTLNEKHTEMQRSET
ncbi:MAG: sodium:solute symporter family protein [Opitutales bacterium]